MLKWKCINLTKRLDRGGIEPFNAYETGLEFPEVIGMSFSSVEPRMATLYPTRKDYEENPTGEFITVTQANEFGPVAIPITENGKLVIKYIADEHWPGGEEEWEAQFTSPDFKSWEE